MATSKPSDVHLMIVESERYLDEFVKAGAGAFVISSAVFGSGDRSAAIAALRHGANPTS